VWPQICVRFGLLTVLRRHDQVLQDPTALVGLLVAGQVVAWTLAPALTHSGLPIDVVEGYMWGREWVLATYKHPAMPSWALEASRVITGAIGWPAYLVSQLFVVATYVFVFLLGRHLLGAERAAAGTLLLTGVAFFAWPTPEFNHNIAEMPFWAAVPWALWLAVERRGIAWWLLVGVFAAAGLYAKLSTALLLLTVAGWILWDGRARQCLATPGPWLGFAVFLLLVAPLAHWLMTHGYGPLHHVAARSAQAPGHGHGLHTFFLSLLANLAGVLAMLWVGGLLGPGWIRGAREEQPGSLAQPVDRRIVSYLAVITLGPLLLAITGAVLGGASLKSAWGSSMFNLVGLLAIALVTRQFDARALRRIAVCAAAALVLVPIGYAAVMAYGPTRDGRPVRVGWPQAAISERLVEAWARETGRPLRIVAGDSWIAGLVGVGAPSLPSIFTFGDPALAPWITPARVEREGMLIVWDGRTKHLPERLRPFLEERPARVERFPWKWSKKVGELEIGYVIVPPK
jgi:4-amino-4-deoxy-L-arabinose transferase-like glycosyltransferase